MTWQNLALPVCSIFIGYGIGLIHSVSKDQDQWMDGYEAHREICKEYHTDQLDLLPDNEDDQIPA